MDYRPARVDRQTGEMTFAGGGRGELETAVAESDRVLFIGWVWAM